MNVVDALCVLCEQPTRYDGTLPIICQSCKSKEHKSSVANEGVMGMLINNTLVLHRTNPDIK